MQKNKTILVGCDDAILMNEVVAAFRNTEEYGVINLITAGRAYDVINFIGPLKPALIIIAFRNNQIAIDSIERELKSNLIPLVCVAAYPEDNILKWGFDKSVFIYDRKHLPVKGLFFKQVQSILNLRPGIIAMEDPNTGSLRNGFMQSDGNDLSRYVMELDQKVDLLSKLKERISVLYPQVDDRVRRELISIVNNIKSSLGDHKLWEDFKVYFEKTNPDFLFRLAEKHPDLTTMDLKYCCYVKMNMSNDDIKKLLGINQESVRTHKYRLKKKMLLSKSQSLSQYLLSFSFPNVMAVC